MKHWILKIKKSNGRKIDYEDIAIAETRGDAVYAFLRVLPEKYLLDYDFMDLYDLVKVSNKDIKNN